jgi:hypothetical protein
MGSLSKIFPKFRLKKVEAISVTYLHDNNLFFHPVMQRACKLSEVLQLLLALNVKKLKF